MDRTSITSKVIIIGELIAVSGVFCLFFSFFIGDANQFLNAFLRSLWITGAGIAIIGIAVVMEPEKAKSNEVKENDRQTN